MDVIQQASPMEAHAASNLHVAYDFNLLGLMSILLCVLVLVFVASKLSGRTPAALLGGGFLMLIMLMLITLGFGCSDSQRQAAYRETAGEDSTDPALVSTEEMWEHLHRPRIVLDSDEQDSSKAAVVSNAKKRVSEQGRFSRAQEPSKQEPSDKNRPSWVDNSPKRVGNVYRVVVTSGPYKTEEECYQHLDPQLREVVKQRIEQLMPGSSMEDLRQLGIGLKYVLREICTEAWVETSLASFGEMKKVHILMQFAAAQDKQLEQAVRSYQRTDRIAGVGTVAGATVASLMLLYGLFKTDTLTKGYYSKRLFFGVPAVIIVIVLLNYA